MGNANIEKSIALGRPVVSASKRARMRREIADIAKRLFQEDGYAKISIRRIVRNRAHHFLCLLTS